MVEQRSEKQLMRFGTHCPKILAPWHIETLSLRKLRKQQSRKGIWPPALFFLETDPKTPGGRHLPCPRSRIARDGDLGAKKSVQTNPDKLTLIFLVSSSPFTTPRPNPSVLAVLHKCIVSLSNRYKNFLLWSLLQDLILLWRLPCTCKNSVHFVCFSPVTLSLSV